MTWHYQITTGYGWATQYGTEQTDNASEIWRTLVNVYGWTENSASAVIGNFQYESALNPGQFEHGKNYSMSDGFGLGQWTPATKISNYIGSTNKNDMSDGAKQMLYFLASPGQYSTYFLNPDGSSRYYNETGLPYITNMADFSRSNASISNLTKLWAICWERPGSAEYHRSISTRIDYATHWFNEFSGSPTPPPTPPPDPPPPPEPPTPPRPPKPIDAQTFFYIMMILKRRKKRR